MVVLGDNTLISFKYAQIWHAFRLDILFTIWKNRNSIIYAHNMLDINVTMYIKACIYNNVMLQIQVQIGKVALEVAHLQELLAHWGNAPCTVACVLLPHFSLHTNFANWKSACVLFSPVGSIGLFPLRC